MRKWCPRIVYDLRAELEKAISFLPKMLRVLIENTFNKLLVELYGEDVGIGPKEKNNWFGDERW